MTNPDTGSTDPYLNQVMTDIQAEVRRRRAAGDFPPSQERRLDRIFARFTPVGAQDGHFAEALKKADRSAYVDIEVPTASEKPGVSRLKRLLRSLMAWYLNYVVQQIVHFTSATMRVLHLLDERVGELEDEAAAHRAPPLGEADEAVVVTDFSAWSDLVVEDLAGVKGRVLHAGCGDGSVLDRLLDLGVDAYGVDSRAELLDVPARKGLDVRLEVPFEHLDAVSDSSLSGLILSGFPDRLVVGAQRRLASVAAAKLAPGGHLILLGTWPRAWVQTAGEVASDLAPGRPLHPSTWRHLFAQVGLDVDVIQIPGGEDPRAGVFPLPDGVDGLIPVPGDDELARAINANLERLNQTLYGPASFAVVGAASR